MRRGLAVMAALLAAVAAGADVPAAAPAASSGGSPAVRGTASAVLDARDGQMLAADGADERHAVASTTKLMTALLTLERGGLGRTVTAASYRPLPAESQIGLRPGERMRVKDLLVALLLESANDASVTLAERVAGSRPAFVRAMNARARELGLRDTSYANPIGLDDRRNYSSARDLAVLARTLMAKRAFRAIVDRPRATLQSGARPRTLDNRNRLVARAPFVDGVKTGHTREAGYVLVGSATGRGARVISVVLGEPSEAARDSDSLALLRWGLGQFRRLRPVRAGSTLARPAVAHFDGRRIALRPARPVSLTVRRGQRVSTRISAPAELTGPLPAGRGVGAATVLVGGRPVRRVALVTAGAVPEAGFVRRLSSGVSSTVLFTAAVLAVAAIALVARRRGSGRRRRRTPAAR